MGWLGKVEGKTSILLRAEGGKAPKSETICVIAGKVTDAAGNEAEIRITFVTRA